MNVCKVCFKSFDTDKKLKSHILSEHGLYTKEYYDKYIKNKEEGICRICGKETNFHSLSSGYNIHCSTNCSNKSKIVKEKKKQTLLDNYGVEHHMKSEKVKEKMKQISLERYGVEHSFQSEEVKNKIREINLQKYGTENPKKLNKVKEKGKETCLNKYGVSNPLQLNRIKEVVSRKNRKNFEKTLYYILDYLKLELVDEKYEHAAYLHNWRCLNCKTQFKQIWNRIQQGFLCPNCYPRNQSSKSEKEIFEFLRFYNLTVELNNKHTIKPYELDIYIPSKNVAIEFNGLYWHSDKFLLDKNYHLNKTIECENKGIQLIHIFEDEWVFKQEIVKEKLKQILNINKNKIRINNERCYIQEIDTKTKNNFLEQFHLQGKDKSSVKLGVFYNNQLISVMTFFKYSRSENDVWGISRFCNNYNYYIFEVNFKLFEYFKNNYKWDKIISYIDKRWNDSNLYKQLGFEYENDINPNYWYTDGYTRIRSKNQNNLKDFYKIFDCGNIVFSYHQ